MDVSISKRMMPLFGLLCAGALMWASALFCPNVALAQPAEASDSARIYILPFEYMDAILIESDGHFGMVDSGESSDSPDGSDSRYPVRSDTTVGQGVEDQVTAFMQSMGVTSENFDFYIGTHPHSDHIGAAGQIISAFKPARIYTPLYDDSMITNPDALWDNQYVYDLLVSAAQEAQAEYGASFIQRFDESAPVDPEDESNVGNPHFTLGSAQIDIMNTNGSDALGTFVDANCISLGVKVTAGGATAFLSGDINNLCGAEDALASELGHVDFLKLGHHGFNNSNSIGYLKALSPKFVFQTGRYSTMREELVRALCEIGSRYYSSADVVNDGSAAFEVSLSSAGVTTNGEYCIPRLYSGEWGGGTYHLYRDGVPVLVSGWVRTESGWTWFNADFSSYDSHWVHTGGSWYWIDEYGEMATGWCEIDGQWYAFDESGAMRTGWCDSGASWYWLDSDGTMATGWCEIDGQWYFFNNSGAMRTSWYDDGSSWYWFGSDGAMATGWRSIAGSWYCFDSSGSMLTGWKQSAGSWCYLDGSGAMVTGWLNENDSWYYFDDSGVMKANCWMGDYYFLPDGAMATNAVIDGYRIGPDGKWIP